MAFRFWRRIKIAPGITVNMSKSGASLSLGPRGSKITVGPKGNRATVGIPGSGFYYTKQLPKSSAPSQKDAPSSNDTLKLGLIKRLFTSDEEKSLVEGLAKFISGDTSSAYEQFCASSALADGAFLAGFIALDLAEYQTSAGYLKQAAAQHEQLGTYFSKYEVTPNLLMKVTPEISAYVEPNLRGVLLGLAEAYQAYEKIHEAVEVLERLRVLDPDDGVIKVSLAELLLEDSNDEQAAAQEILSFIDAVQPESPVHVALMLYQAKALRILNLSTAARDVLTKAYRKKHGIPAVLRQAVLYERALAYEDLGQLKRYREELEKLYALDPNFEDTAHRLGIGTHHG